MKRRVLLLAAIVALIAGAGIAYAAGSGGGLPGGEPAVWGGGQFFFAQYGVTRDFSVVATPDGGKYVYGRFGLGANSGVGPVTCMRVSGNHAVIGGPGVNSPYPFIAFMTDNGNLAATPDQVSPIYLLETSDIEAHWSGVTKYFPYVCPPFSAMANDVTMYDLTSGDIVVQNAIQNSQQ